MPYIQMDDTLQFMDSGSATMDGLIDEDFTGVGNYARGGGGKGQKPNFEVVKEADLTELAPGLKV